jgi:hypothetical protein
MCSDSFAKEHHSTGSINSIGRMPRVNNGQWRSCQNRTLPKEEEKLAEITLFLP